MSRHALETHQTISGCLSVSTLLARFPEITTAEAEWVRGEDDRRLTYLLREALRQYGRRPTWVA